MSEDWGPHLGQAADYVHRRFGISLDTTVQQTFYQKLLIELRVARAKSAPSSPFIVGIIGGQGTGKTLLSAYLVAALRSAGCRADYLSIDDYYSSYEERATLRAELPDNPFYAIYRGVPGTHRVSLLEQHLAAAQAGQNFAAPIFDKNIRNGFGDITSRTRPIDGQLDFLFLEGWFTGLPLWTSEDLSKAKKQQGADGPLQRVLTKLDPTEVHLAEVATRLVPYQSAWGKLDGILGLFAQDLSWIRRWRFEQEAYNTKISSGRALTQAEVERFVEPFLPMSYLAKFLFSTGRFAMPHQWAWQIGPNHQPQKALRVGY